MNPTPSSATKPPTIEQGVNALVSDAKRKVTDTYHEYEDYVRDTPAKAMLIAIAAGYIIHRLPVRALLVAQVRLVAALAPPTMLAFGAAKLCEFLQGEAVDRRQRKPKTSALGTFE